MDAATYARARERGIPARYALDLARFAVRPLMLQWTTDRHGNRTARGHHSGFDVRIRTVPDYETNPLEDIGAIDWGRYSDDAGRTVPERPVRDAYPVKITTRSGPAWYVSDTTLASRVAYHRERGASRAVALDMARADVRAEAAPWNGADGPYTVGVIVEAYRADVLLGSASVWGVTADWNDLTRTDGTRYVEEVALDLIPEAIADATASLARLCAPEGC